MYLAENEIVKQHTIEVRSFKWPYRPTSIAMTRFLGQDAFGRWLGITRGDPWWSADHSVAGVFIHPFVKLVPNDTFWTACFNPSDPIVDVDIVLPVRWIDCVLEEVDLELDIIRSAEGHVFVRDQETFDHVREQWNMPDTIAIQAETTCALIRSQVEDRTEPFGMVGQEWLTRFLADTDAL
jgi:hypothetical protein